MNDNRLTEAALEASQPPPPGARQRVWAALEAGARPRSGARTFVYAMGSFAIGVALVGLFFTVGPPKKAPLGVSLWASPLPAKVSTCHLESRPCLQLVGSSGARFTLDTSTHSVRLAVQVGSVQVTDADGVVHLVLASDSAEYSVDAVRLARAAEASGDFVKAEAALAEAAKGTSLGAEVALYEQGVLRMRRTNDLAGALTLFEQWQARFPRGALAPEVALSRLEVLSKLGRDADAIAAGRQFLNDFPQSERASEVERLIESEQRQ